MNKRIAVRRGYRKAAKTFLAHGHRHRRLDVLLIEAHQAKGGTWVSEEPLWVTWPLEKFGMLRASLLTGRCERAVSFIPTLLNPYHRSLHIHPVPVGILREPLCLIRRCPVMRSQSGRNSPLDTFRLCPGWLEDDGWGALWEDLSVAEVERWYISKLNAVGYYPKFGGRFPIFERGGYPRDSCSLDV
ncbi:hypothetical protein K438DRAFT_1061921 [Mycena galopus ATCC 62051]|nr:hypothetical protein K438DRAFT_1061921 [Mycena galopus ATCC 62051]